MKKCNISPVASPERKAEKQKRPHHYQDTNLEDVIENIDSQEQLKKQIASIEFESVGTRYLVYRKDELRGEEILKTCLTIVINRTII